MQRENATSCSSRFCGQAWEKRTEMGPVLEVKTFCHLDVHQSLGGHIPRSKCYVDELRYRDPGSHEEADNGSMQETDAEQLTIQSGLQCSQSVDHIPIRERKWEDITANEFSHKYELGYHISKFVGRLVRHENRHDREADGAIHWRLTSQKLKFAFLKYGGDTFTDRDWIHHIWKGSNKTRFQCCQNSCNNLLYIRVVQRHIGGNLIKAELMGRVAISINCNQFFHRGCSFFQKSILEAGFVAGRKESREGRNCVLFSLGSLGCDLGGFRKLKR